MNSMTGHGQASWSSKSVAIDVQIRSVNNRFLKVVTHLPEKLETLAPDLEEALRKHLDRGTVHLDVHLRQAVGKDTPLINEQVLGLYYQQLRDAMRKLGMKAEPSWEALLALPGVLDSSEAGTHAEALAERVFAVVDEAAKQLCAMRRREGERTGKEITRLLGNIEKSVKQVRKLAPQVPAAHQERMLARLNGLLAPGQTPLGTAELARELAMYADRCDISEEMQRLESHLAEFRTLMRATGEAGRKLDFLSQELLRETNTIGSKANDAEIANLVIAMKCEIEKIKEQVQNIE